MIFKKSLTNEEFNPRVIMNSGQVFRMQIESQDHEGLPEVYSAYSGDNDLTFYFNKESDTWDFICDEAQWAFWQKYFDFDTDYIQFNSVIRLSDDKFLSKALKDSFGMRILRQDLWEVFISYVISQNNNIPKIKKSINILCNRYSDGIHFPSADVLASLSEEELMDNTALGYRAGYIIGIAKQVADGSLVLSDFEKMSYDDAYNKLISIKGIGPKVANCIMLYGFHFMESYPIDTWMQKIIAEDYSNYDKNDYLKYINETYSGFQGYVQQLQFYYKRNNR